MKLTWLNEFWKGPQTNLIHSSTTLLFDVEPSDYSFPIHSVAKTMFANIPGKLAKYLQKIPYIFSLKKSIVFEAILWIFTLQSLSRKPIFAEIPGKLAKYLRIQFLMLKKFTVFDDAILWDYHESASYLASILSNKTIAEPSLKKMQAIFTGPRCE